jgi:diguanylate cyclase (GGDEF)-like protein
MTIKVFIHNGPLKGGSMQINKDSASIGRGPNNDVRIDESSVSKRHAMIFKTPKGYLIGDLRSQNGTWIDGSLIPSGKKIEIESGVPISVGNVLVSVGKPLPRNFASVQASIDLGEFITECDKKSILEDTLMTNRRRLQQIFEISKLLMHSLETREVYDKILDSLFIHFKKLETGVILLREEDSGFLRQVASKVRDKRRSKKIHINRSIVGQAINQSKAVMITRGSSNGEGNLLKDLEFNGIVCVICVPLITKAGILGVIYVYSSNFLQGFRKEDLFFITSISSPAAVAIENALLHDKSKQSEKELRRARDELEAKVQERTSELANANAKLRELSIRDDLTGLFNRRYLDRALEAEFIRAIRYRRNFSLLLLDIDSFKVINDSYGHMCGDAVLVKAAFLIRGCLRNSDVVARYGGDEIAILLPETDKSSATEIAEKLRHLIEGTCFEWREKTINITSSIGLAAVPDDSIADWVDMLDKADKALYRGKESGKNVVVPLKGSNRQVSLTGQQPGPRSRLVRDFRGSVIKIAVN